MDPEKAILVKSTVLFHIFLLITSQSNVAEPLYFIGGFVIFVCCEFFEKQPKFYEGRKSY